MKKFTAVLLAALMCLALTACSAEGSAYEAAVKLMEEGNYKDAITAFEELGEYKDSAEKVKEAKGELKKQKATELICKGVWFFNGGAINTVNNITFTKDAAIIGQTYYDGNGRHDAAPSNCTYTIDTKNITVTLADASELKISYTLKDGKLKLGNKEYFTPKEVEKGLQGYWSCYSAGSYVAGMKLGASEYIYFYDNGKITFESATEANPSFYEAGTIFYYTPKTGTYTIDADGLNVDASNNWQFGFNIIDGEVTALRCDKVCKRTNGFKGENGYEF